MYSVEIQAQINEWRARAITGELTLEELTSAIALMREGRLSAAKSASTTGKKKAAEVDVGDIERELGL